LEEVVEVVMITPTLVVVLVDLVEVVKVVMIINPHKVELMEQVEVLVIGDNLLIQAILVGEMV